MTDLEREIRSEIAKAVARLGGSPEFVATIRGASKKKMYDAAEQLGADRYLLATIGSRGDTLKQWNAGAAAEKMSPG
jgi:hypothetical protein